MIRYAFALCCALVASSATAACDMGDLLPQITFADDRQKQQTIADCAAQNTDWSRQDGDGFSALSLAVTFGDVTSLRAMLDAGANPNMRDSDGSTPALTAVSLAVLRDPEPIQVMLNHLANASADLNAEARDGVFPLDMAAGFDGGLPVLEHLLALGADPNHVNRLGRSALFATVQGDCRHDSGTALLAAGATATVMADAQLARLRTGAELMCNRNATQRAYRDRLIALATP